MMRDTGEIALSEVAAGTIISVQFPVQGERLPADHGYELYAAITKALPALHRCKWLGVELISGVPWKEEVIVLPRGGASLRLRLPADCFGEVLALAGKRLHIGDESIRVGFPSARPLTSSPSLYSRSVTINKFIEPEPFLEVARRQLITLGIATNLELLMDEQGQFQRYPSKIYGNSVIGFSLVAYDLSNEHSLNLQSVGLGEHRAMGCGIFNPLGNPSALKEQRRDISCPH